MSSTQRNLIIGIGAVGVLAVLGGVALLMSQPRTPTSTGSAVCGNLQQVADEGRGHLKAGEPVPTYKSIPPTSGTHNVVSLPAGVYGPEADITMLIHSLEHGYIVIYHNGLTTAEQNQLANIQRSDPYKVIVAPYAKMPYRVALAAWNRLQTCDGINEQAIRSFINQFRGQGPEPFGAMN